MKNLEPIINDAFENRSAISPVNCTSEIRGAIDETIAALNDGKTRVSEKSDGECKVN